MLSILMVSIQTYTLFPLSWIKAASVLLLKNFSLYNVYLFYFTNFIGHLEPYQGG